MADSNIIELSTQDIAGYLEGHSDISDLEMLQAMIANPELCETIEVLTDIGELEELTEIKDVDHLNEL